MRGRRVVSTTLRVAADVGGTFTDTRISDAEPVNVRIEKVPPTADPIEVVLDGAEKPAVRARSRSRKLQSLRRRPMSTMFNLDRQIASAPEALRKILTTVEVPKLDGNRPIIFTGIGTSLHAARVAAGWVTCLSMVRFGRWLSTRTTLARGCHCASRTRSS